MKTSAAYSPAHAFVDTFVAPADLFSRSTASLYWAKWCAVLIISAILLSTYYFFQSMPEELGPTWHLKGLGQLLMTHYPRLFANTHIAGLSPGLYIGLCKVLNILLLVAVLGAAYWIMERTTQRSGRFNLLQWCKIVMVCQLPWLANYCGLVLLTFSAADTALPFSMLDYASLNHLFFHLEPHSSWYPLFHVMNLFHFWSIGLTITAVNRCLEMSRAKSVIFTLLPYTLLIGLSAQQ